MLKIVNYIGAMFFIITCMIIAPVSSTALYSKDRYEAVDRVANGIFTPAVYVGAMFAAAIVYSCFVSFVFICIFHWISNINPDGTVFVYDFLMAWAVMLLMEGVLLNFVEAMKNAFLCTTCGMVFLGSCMAFCGFFRPVEDMVPWINWMSYIIPIKYVYDGLATQIFHSQTFHVTNSSPHQMLTGDEILDVNFRLKGVNSWGMFGVALAYMFVLRFNQYLLFAWQTGTLFSAAAPTGTVQKATIQTSSASLTNVEEKVTKI
jgi:ABC-type multidrug transport system permease subunit